MAGACAIIGAGEGLGAALAARFAAGGYDLALVSRSDAAAAREAALAARSGCDVRFEAADATDPPSIATALAKIGAVDVLIYNVRGAFTRCAPLDMTTEALEQIFAQEVVGAFAAAKAVLPAMREKGAGTILFSSATAAFRGSADYPLYAIGKFGVRALSQSLAKAYGRDGVHVAHMRLDCDLDVPIMRAAYGPDADGLANPRDVAETYWLTHLQPKGAWSNEVEIRPHTENWTY